MRPSPQLLCHSKLLAAMAGSYRLVVSARSWLYQNNWLAQHRLPCRVLSVGNLTVGGTGKTPFVMWIAQRLTDHGQKVSILSRGYRRRSKEPCLLVSNGQELLVGPHEAGDEPFLMARRCPGVSVAVGSNRYRLGCWVMDQMPVDAFVLDDGFQHLALYRDVDLLLIDATDVDGLRQLLPTGRLREPLFSASRATAVVLTRTEIAKSPREALDPIENALGMTIQPILTRFQASAVVNIFSGKSHEAQWLNGKRALVFSGIGNDGSFRVLLQSLGVCLLDELVFPDHYHYTLDDVVTIERRARNCKAELILTTEKDAVRIEGLMGQGEDLWTVRLETQIVEGGDRLERLLVGKGGTSWREKS